MPRLATVRPRFIATEKLLYVHDVVEAIKLKIVSLTVSQYVVAAGVGGVVLTFLIEVIAGGKQGRSNRSKAKTHRLIISQNISGTVYMLKRNDG